MARRRKRTSSSETLREPLGPEKSRCWSENKMFIMGEEEQKAGKV
jgi:hypothetical protein